MYKLLSDQRIFMNTLVEFTAWTNLSRDKVHEIFDKGFGQFHLVVEQFSRFHRDSELSRLNLSSGTPISCSKELFELISFAIEIAHKTNGAFDPTVIDFLEMYGYDAHYNFAKLDGKQIIKKEIQQLLKMRPNLEDIHLYKKQRRIALAPHQRIDLGGIGKGYAIDRAFAELLPLKNFVINAGGDIRTKGKDKNGQSWKVSLKVPGHKPLGVIELQDKAICCSGSWARKVKFFHHLINPKNGTPQNQFKAVFTVAEKAKKADAWATALFVLGPDALQYAQKYYIQTLLYDQQEKVLNYKFPHILPLEALA